MNSLIPFIIIGLATGSVYGLAGTGLVLTYKTSGIFNFAYGSVGALAVFVFYWLHDQNQVPWPIAVLICLGVVAPIAGVLLELMARALETAGAALKVVATIGLLLIVLGVGTIWFGDQILLFPNYLPTSTVTIGGANVTWAQIIVVIIAVLTTAALYAFFRFVRLGIAMRGVVDNPELVSSTGENPIRVRRWAWIIGTIFASMAGLLLAPSLSLDALTITLLVVQAFGAAAIGYFSSLPLTFAGGLFIGVFGAIVLKYSATISWLSGVPAGLPFVILFVVLIVTPKVRLADRRVLLSLPVKKSWYAPARVRIGGGAGAVLLLLFIPYLVGTDLVAWSAFLVDVILFLSLGLLVRKSGQISLCQLAFAAIGAAVFAHCIDDWHVPWLLALVIVAVVAIPVGAFISIPAIRLSGVFLALATLGFGIFVEQTLYLTNIMFTVNPAGIPAPRPDLSIGPWNLSTDRGFYYVILLFAVLAVVMMLAIDRGRLGRLLAALADSPAALETQGASANSVRVLVFCISTIMASVAGALTASLYQFALGSEFSSLNSLTLLAVVVIIVAGDPWYAIMAALGYGIVPAYLTVSNINTYMEIVFGLGAASYALQINKVPSVPKWLRGLLDRLGGRPTDLAVTSGEVAAALVRAERTESAAAERQISEDLADASARGQALVVRHCGLLEDRPPALEVQNVEVRFTGVLAVDRVSLRADIGRITGLIGPNGAGKTTVFNVCSGLVRPRTGRVLLGGSDITHESPARRARLGLGRTFQRSRLFDSLTVRENIDLGREASLAGSNPFRQMVGSRYDRGSVAAISEDVIEITGVGPLLDLQAGLLPTGQRRLVEVARALAGPFNVLLLDEPSSGLDETETRILGEIFAYVARERDVAILLVEHDMSLVTQVCDHIYVLDFGKLLFDGSPSEVLQSELVKSAYLGTETRGDRERGNANVPVEGTPSIHLNEAT